MKQQYSTAQHLRSGSRVALAHGRNQRSQSRTQVWLASAAFGLLAIATFHNAQAQGATGEELFAQCRGCHQVGPDAKHQYGPKLNGVMVRPAGSADGYAYSPAMNSAVEKGLRWTDETLDAFLTAPLQYMTGSKMAFAGIADEAERKALIDYLRSIDVKGNRPDAETIAADEEKAAAADAPRKLASEFPVAEHGVLHLGRVALEEEVAAWDIDVRPDGTGLPEGSGSVVDGGPIYDATCASCHGDFGEGTGRWPILAGGQDSLTDARPEKTIGSFWPYLSTVYDYIRRAMPFGNARSLSDDEVYAITAYLLYLNDLVDEDFVLTSENFTSVEMPNTANFIDDNRDQEAYRSLGEPCMVDCNPEPAEITQRAQVLDVTPDVEQ